MRSTRSKILVAVAIAGVLAVGALFARSGSALICDHCGAMADETDWYIPFTSVHVSHTGPHVGATPLSTTLTSLGLADAAAPHHWLLAHQLSMGGEGLGVGHSFYVTVQSDRVAELIRAAHSAGDTEFRDQLVRCAFDRETTGMLWHLAETAPAGAFSDAAAFRAWQRDNASDIQRFLHINPPNQAIHRTARRASIYFVSVCHSPVHCESRSTGLAVADLVSR